MNSNSRKPLSRHQVLQAAMELADAGGLQSLSMRKLAVPLRVQAMSLYNHVKNKDDILDGLVDLVASEIAIPAIGGDWRQSMRQRSISAHETLLRHPWATMLIVSRINTGPAMLRYVDATIGCLREAGFSFPMADQAWHALDSHIYGFTLQELNFPIEHQDYAATAENYLELIPADKFPYLNGMAIQVIEKSHDGLNEFSFGLDLILDGLERMLENARP